MEWRNKPTLLEYWPDNVDFILGLDENGTSDIEYIKRCLAANIEIDPLHRHFTLTGVVFNRVRYEKLKEDMNKIKFEYWENGLYDHKGEKRRVCFHSREIRNKSYPFNYIDYDNFIKDLTNMIKETKTKVISCSIDKKNHCQQYRYPIHPYPLSLGFILERFCYGLNKVDKKGILIIESRGYKEDSLLLKHIVNILDHGTNQNPSSHFRNIEGVYFNPKWWLKDNNRSSFVILEFADLLSYPIHKYSRNGCMEKDQAFCEVEKKFFRYPDYVGWGFKRFP